MSVERRTNPDTGAVSFLVRWRAGGRQRSKSFAAAKLGGIRKAERLANQFDADVSAQLVTTGVVVQRRGAQTLANVWTGWYDDGCTRWTPETRETYASAMDVHILPRLGDHQLATITPATVESFTAAMARDDVGKAAAHKAVTVLSSLLSHTVRSGLLDTNPVRAARKPPATRERTPLKITPLQVERVREHLLEQGRHGDAVLVSLLAYAGLRPESEALVLDWRDLADKRLHIRPNRKRGAKPRTVDLLEPLAADLKAWRRQSGRIGGLVIPFGDGGVSGFGGAWTGDQWNRWRTRRWKPAAKAAGLPADAIPRDLRGSFASLLIWEGRSVIDVARQLGHKPSTCLDVYSGEFEDFDPVARTPAIDVIDRARGDVFGESRARRSA